MDCDTNNDDVRDRNGHLSLAARVESLLFVADEPTSLSRLAEALGVTTGKIESALDELEATYAARGLCLQWVDNRVQLVTVPEAAPHVERFLGLAACVHLSQAALEALAIIAYRQPVTRPELEAIRGVGSDSVLRTLLNAGLIERVGRAEAVGRPYLYSTTSEFLQHFGLRTLDELPPLEKEAPVVQKSP